MHLALLFGRLILAAVFFVAALAKLVDRPGSRRAIAEFGSPARLTGPLGILLPLAELAVAVALVPTATAWRGALGAFALLLIFVAAIGINLARGRKPDCRCFGQLASSPVGWRTLVRNGVLAAIAAFVAMEGRHDPGSSAVAWVGKLTTPQMIALGACLALVALVVLEGAFVVNLLRQNGRLLNRLETIEERLKAAGIAPAPAQQRAEAERGLSVGSPAPEFRLPGLYGETLTIGALRAAGKPIMLLFTDPNCGPCNALLPEIGRWQHDYAGQLTVALISNGDEDANRAKCAEHGLTNVLLQADREVSEAYGENGTPSAVVVYPDGRIGSSLASGADAIRLLLTRVIGMPSAVLEPTVHPAAAQNGGGDGTAAPSLSRESVPGIGEQAPAVKLPDVNGRTINLTGYRGSRTLLLFWNPACGFCQQMLDDLKGWEAAAPEDAPKLLVISTGSIEANRALGLNSPVLVDPDFSIASSFGANGTPMAVLVDEEGRIASDVAAGGQSVLALARPQGHLTGARS